ncbi:hypothetical protein FJTKL_11255 [Diaporthe vaccinii]|uniref:Uncharacterized protein n=1 Tax=Diaporthe vaccinii TaxID=105482 RepID=A0ABR4EH51_9PEZI
MSVAGHGRAGQRGKKGRTGVSVARRTCGFERNKLGQDTRGGSVGDRLGESGQAGRSPPDRPARRRNPSQC